VTNIVLRIYISEDRPKTTYSLVHNLAFPIIDKEALKKDEKTL
jgi:hypothetical protein